jgi:hypothetical protein
MEKKNEIKIKSYEDQFKYQDWDFHYYEKNAMIYAMELEGGAVAIMTVLFRSKERYFKNESFERLIKEAVSLRIEDDLFKTYIEIPLN